MTMPPNVRPTKTQVLHSLQGPRKVTQRLPHRSGGSHETSASGGTRVCSDTIPKARGFEDDGGPQRDAIIASSTVDATLGMPAMTM